MVTAVGMKKICGRMGNHEDQPVVGDWDGDGKDDIGVFGLQWRAMVRS